MVDCRLKSKIPSKINTIMKKRGACILKKARELSVLCDIRVCALIADPNNGKFHTWPENQTQVIDLLRQFKNVENKKKKKKSCDVNGQTEKRKNMNKMKNLDYSCFDDKSINQLSRDSVTEISKLLNLKIEVARKRVEFLKKKLTVSDKGFQHFNASPNFDPNFNPSEMMLDFPWVPSISPSSIGALGYYFGQKQLGAISFGNNSEPEIMLDFPTPLSYYPSVDTGCSSIRVPEIILNYPPPLSYSGVDNGCSSIRVPDNMLDYPQTVFYSGVDDDFSSIRVPENMIDYPQTLSYSSVDNGCSSIRVPSNCYFGSENASSGSTYIECNSPLDFPPPLSYSPSVDNGCSTIRVPEIILDYPPPLSYSGVEYYGCSTSDCYFGSENTSGGRTYAESASPFEEGIEPLQHSPIELKDDMLYGGASMATIPLQPLQLIDYSFY